MCTAYLLCAANLLCAAHLCKSQSHTLLPGEEHIIKETGMKGSPWPGDLSTRRKQAKMEGCFRQRQQQAQQPWDCEAPVLCWGTSESRC